MIFFSILQIFSHLVCQLAGSHWNCQHFISKPIQVSNLPNIILVKQVVWFQFLVVLRDIVPSQKRSNATLQQLPTFCGHLVIVTFLSFDKRLCYVGHSNCLNVWLLHVRLFVALVDPNAIADKVNSVKKQITDIIKVAEVSPSWLYQLGKWIKVVYRYKTHPLREKTGCFFVYHDFICVLTSLIDFMNRLLLLKRRITWTVLVVKSRMK